MTTLADELELLKIQQEKLEKRIQDEKEQKRLKQQSTMEHLEDLVKPFTKYLDKKRNIEGFSGARKVTSIRKFLEEIEEQVEEEEEEEEEEEDYIINAFRNAKNIYDDISTLEKEEIYVTLIGILKKQDERIKELEKNMG